MSSPSSPLPPLFLSCLAQPMFYLYPWQPEGRELYEIKGTGSRETGHICFDVFTSYKRRWQPLSASTHDALGHLSASGHFTFPFLRIVTFLKKRQTSQTRMHPLHLSYPPFKITFFKLFDVRLCFGFIPLKYETCQLL